MSCFDELTFIQVNMSMESGHKEALPFLQVMLHRTASLLGLSIL